MSKYLFYTLISYFSFLSIASAQSSLAYDIGVIAGPSFLKSDYGQRNDLKTNLNNSGFGVGFVHYLNFSSKSKYNYYFNEHFRVRSEISFNKASLGHYGVYSDGNSLDSQQLKAMSGKSSIASLGGQLEFSPFNEIHAFEVSTGSFLPYISLGFLYSYYNIKTSSTMGELGTDLTTFPKFLTPTDNHPFGFSSESGSVFSIVSGIGTRYKLNPMADLLVDLRMQYYFSDWIDGLKPNPDLYKENKSNDVLLWFNVGYIYYIPY